MLAHLHTTKADSLIVDCGDFFEDSGFYRFGKGRIEHEILTGLYDLLAPGNHGWPHYFEPGLHEMTVCSNVAGGKGNPLFDRVRIKPIGGHRVAVTAVIGPQAFNAAGGLPGGTLRVWSTDPSANSPATRSALALMARTISGISGSAPSMLPLSGLVVRGRRAGPPGRTAAGTGGR